MDIMKRILLFTIALFFAVNLQSFASITVEQLTEPDYVINNGYSEAVAEQIVIQKNRYEGKPAEPLYEKHNRFTRFIRNAYGILDPAQDTDERIHHNIHMSPNAKDL